MYDGYYGDKSLFLCQGQSCVSGHNCNKVLLANCILNIEDKQNIKQEETMSRSY